MSTYNPQLFTVDCLHYLMLLQPVTVTHLQVLLTTTTTTAAAAAAAATTTTTSSSYLQVFFIFSNCMFIIM